MAVEAATVTSINFESVVVVIEVGVGEWVFHNDVGFHTRTRHIILLPGTGLLGVAANASP